MLNDNAYKQLQEMLNEAEQAHDFLEKSVEDFTYCIPHDVLKLLVQDALRWKVVLRYLDRPDLERWHEDFVWDASNSERYKQEITTLFDEFAKSHKDK